MVKLLVEEEGSDAAALLVEMATDLVSATIGYVEARSALSRAALDGRLPGRRGRNARIELERVWEETTVLDLGIDLAAFAGEVAARWRLRAGDAIHLASALSLDEPDLLFATWDAELRRAVLEAGVAVAP
jgi:uncharacterized protein